MIATSCYSHRCCCCCCCCSCCWRKYFETFIRNTNKYSPKRERVGRQHWVTNCKWSVIDSAASVADDRWQCAFNASRCSATNANTRFLFSIDFFRQTKGMRSLLWGCVGVRLWLLLIQQEVGGGLLDWCVGSGNKGKNRKLWAFHSVNTGINMKMKHTHTHTHIYSWSTKYIKESGEYLCGSACLCCALKQKNCDKRL